MAAGFATASCQPAARDDTPANATENAVEAPRLPVSDPALDRAAILLAVAHASSSAALGADDLEQQRLLDGKLFELRIRFGCPAGGDGSGGRRFSVSLDEAQRTLRIAAVPDLTLEDPRVASLAGETVEAVEGFWLRRPWLLSAQCPVAAQAPPQFESPPPTEAKRGSKAPDADDKAPPVSPPPAAQSVGIAQFFTTTDARIGRRDTRPYETTKVLAEGEQPSGEGYNLVLAGRLRAMPGGRVISCRVTSGDAPPDCVVSAVFDRVRIERPDTKATLAEWSR
jgi:hypothetical protein